MRIRNFTVFSAALMLGIFAFSGCKNNNASDRECIYQTALLQSLMLGDYYGSVSVGELKKCGDTGIGTFDGVNGELVMLDGVVYAALSDGRMEVMGDDVTVPFSNVTFVEADVKETVKDVSSMENLKGKMTDIIEKCGTNYFYMAKIKADCDYVQYRSEYKQNEPYKPLAEVMLTDQVVFEDKNLSGTIVALYCPNFMNGLNTSGWHFHFISDDKTKGGHVLNVKFSKGEATIDKTENFKMLLPQGEFFKTLDLTTDLEKAINKVEKNTD